MTQINPLYPLNDAETPASPLNLWLIAIAILLVVFLPALLACLINFIA